MNSPKYSRRGFTIVELLIVIVVIAILAAITLVAFNGVTRQTKISVLKSDLNGAAKQLGVKRVDDGSYPTAGLPATIKASPESSFEYASNGTSYCLTVRSNSAGVPAFRISDNGSIVEGACDVAVDGAPMQTVTSLNCPTSRVRAVDARDNRSYWVQRMADGKCWMLTNLAYAGGGTNTYSDTKVLQNGTADGASNVGLAKYYIPTGANPTSNPTQPSSSTDGGASAAQYGYLYNTCAAMGAQASTTACALSGSGTPPDYMISVCPAGWRLPTGGPNGEFQLLASALNASNDAAGSGIFRSTWLAQNSGSWATGSFSSQGSSAAYWSASFTTGPAAYNLGISASSLNPNQSGSKHGGLALRCLAV